MMAPSRVLAHGKPCPYCRRAMDRHHPPLAPTRDHVVPESKGGRKTVIACYTCNAIKGDMMPDVWCAFMETFPRWWTLSQSALRRARRENFFTPGYKPPKRMRHLVDGQQQSNLPPGVIYSTDQMEPSEREARRTEKWGPRRSRAQMAEQLEKLQRILNDGASDQLPPPAPESLP